MNERPAADLVLLPGLDGTGELFRPFVDAAPRRFRLDVRSYPREALLGYDELEARLRGDLADGGPFWLLAESFAGPLGARLTDLPGVRGLIFSCSFVRSPRPLVSAVLPLGWLWRLPAPAFLLRWVVAGRGAEDWLVDEVRRVRRLVPRRVTSFRLRETARVDASDELARSTVPVLYLQGRRDRVITPRSACHIQALRPDAETVVLDTGHLLLQTAPATAWSTIEAFIDARSG